MELLNKAKALISTYSYDEAIAVLSKYLNENAFQEIDKINADDFIEIKKSYDLILYVIDQKKDEKLKNIYRIQKISFFSKSNNVDDIFANIKEIETYLNQTRSEQCFVLNILTDAYFKVGELEKATNVAEKYLAELLRFKHLNLYVKKAEEFKRKGIRAQAQSVDAYRQGIRLSKALKTYAESKNENKPKILVNTLYELTLFFNNNYILEELSDLAVKRQDKSLLLSIEAYVRGAKINSNKVESNIKRYGNFPDGQSVKREDVFDFADDLFKKNVKSKKTVIPRKIEEVKFNDLEQKLYLVNEGSDSKNDLIDLVDDKENFLDIASFYLEVGLNRKSALLLEKYLLLNLDDEQKRKLYYLYITALSLSGELSLAKKVLNDFSLNSSFLAHEKQSILELINRLDRKQE